MAHWRDSARRARLGMFDALATWPFLVFLLHIRLWSFYAALAATIFFAGLERFGFSPIVFLRWSRSLLGGKRKMAVPWWR